MLAPFLGEGSSQRLKDICECRHISETQRIFLRPMFLKPWPRITRSVAVNKFLSVKVLGCARARIAHRANWSVTPSEFSDKGLLFLLSACCVRKRIGLL